MKKILIIDDEPDLVKMLSIRLKLNGFDALGALDGATGIAKAKAEKPDLIALDLMMPGIDGYEVARKLKADPGTAHIPIIIVTAAAGNDFERKIAQTQAADCVLKPFNPRELIDKINHVLPACDPRHKSTRAQATSGAPPTGVGGA